MNFGRGRPGGANLADKAANDRTRLHLNNHIIKPYSREGGKPRMRHSAFFTIVAAMEGEESVQR